MKAYRVVIFDWDGTLMDSTERIVDCLRQASVRADLPLLTDDAYRDIIGLSLDTALPTLHPEASSWQLSVMDAVYRWQFMEGSSVSMQPFAGAQRLLQDLKEAGFLLAVATGKSRKGLELALAESGFGAYFDITRSGEETACKPDPLMLQEIVAALGVSVSESVMIGDSVYDLDMARRFGMDAIAMTHGVHSLAKLSAYDPVAGCADLAELRDCLLSGVSVG